MKFLVFPLLLILFFIETSFSQDSRSNRPDFFPTPPHSEKSLFFIQRNRNENTIVYDARLHSNGKYEKSKPIDAYWLRYTSTGYRKDLSWLERTFAYGYSSKKDGSGDGHWVELTAYDDRKIHLEKTSDNKPIATLTINGKYCQLEYIYVFADESGAWPKVIHVDIHGVDMVTGEKIKEQILND